MKKAVRTLVVFLMLLLVVCGCSANKPVKADVPEFKIAIEGVEGVTEFTNKDAAKLEFVKMDTTVTNKKGEESKNNYGGIKLKALLDSIGVKELTSLKIEANDGYAAEYDSALAFSDDVIVAWEKNGSLMENNEINILPKAGKGNQQVKAAVKITVVK